MITAVLASSTAAPVVSVNGWQSVLILAGVLVGSLAVLWKALRPVSRMALLIIAAWPEIKKALPLAGEIAKLGAKADELLALPAAVSELQKSHRQMVDGHKRIEAKMDVILAGHNRVREGDPQ